MLAVTGVAGPWDLGPDKTDKRCSSAPSWWEPGGGGMRSSPASPPGLTPELPALPGDGGGRHRDRPLTPNILRCPGLVVKKGGGARSPVQLWRALTGAGWGAKRAEISQTGAERGASKKLVTAARQPVCAQRDKWRVRPRRARAAPTISRGVRPPG